MSVAAMGACWGPDFPAEGVEDLSPPAIRVVALAIADIVNDVHGNEFYASLPKLAEKVGLHRDTVRRVIVHLVASSVLEVIEERPGRTTRYRWRWIEGVHPAESTQGSDGHPADRSAPHPADQSAATPRTDPRRNPMDPKSEPNAPAPDITTAEGLAHAAATMKMKEYGKHNQIHHPAKLLARLLAEQLEENPARLTRLVDRARACLGAGQTLNVDAFAAAALGEGHRAHLDTVNPDPRVCDSTCRRCGGVGQYEAEPGAGFQPCPGPLDRHLRSVSAS